MEIWHVPEKKQKFYFTKRKQKADLRKKLRKSAWKQEKADAFKHNAEGPTKNLFCGCKKAPGKRCRHNPTGYKATPQSREAKKSKAKIRFNLVGFQRFCKLHGVKNPADKTAYK